MSKFNKDAGEFISLEKGAKFTSTFRFEQRQMRKKEVYSIAAFFGSNKINQLLNKNPEAIGIRIYYGLDVDGDGKADNKFVLVAVDEKGNDILPSKDAKLGKDDSDQDILDGGVYCPLDCAQDNPLNSDL
jgi:hypothetical protein